MALAWRALLWAGALLGAARADWPHCNGVIRSRGITEPRGDITLLQGSDLVITCLLNPAEGGVNASNLRFYRNMDEVVGNETHVLTVVNETALRLDVKKVDPSDSVYYCHIVDGKVKVGVCSNKVVVGTLPQNVSNFKCVSNNWDNLTCTWSPDVVNFIKTNYSLQFKYEGRAGRNLPSNCPRLEFEEGYYKCMWDLTTNPPYRQSQEFFNFNLTAFNLFGKNTQMITFNHYANVKPAPPVNLRVVNVSTNSALLSWSVHHNMLSFRMGLVHRLVYCSELEEKCQWKEANLSSPTTNNSQSYDLALPYPNTRYDVRVFIKTEKARDMWSNFSSTWFKTLSARPAKPPLMDIGSFESVVDLTTRSVFVYWRQVETYEENGENFTYRIVDARTNTKILHLIPEQTTKSYMKFNDISLDRTEITIESFNSEGSSKEKSRITIPAFDEVLPKPEFFTKIEFENGLYELSWGQVKRADLESYTIFWCANYHDNLRCESQILWEKVSPNFTTKNITVLGNKPYQFAISANSKTSSSGMVWAQCTIVLNKSISKISNVWVNSVGDTYIEIAWKIDCLDRIGVIQGYNILYCPIYSLYNKSCKEDRQNITVNKDPSSIQVKNLKPHTTYSIQVAIITKHGVGIMSDPLFNNTREGAPTPPINVHISDLRNNRMMVSWDPPVTLNGYIRHYKIYYDTIDEGNEFQFNINGGYIDQNNKTILEHTLTNLKSYTNYTVTIAACTVTCSKRSTPITVRTAIGKPGRIEKFNVQRVDSSLNLSWSPPLLQGGAIDLYEVMVTKVVDDYKNSSEIFKVNQSEYSAPTSICLEKGINGIYFYVRAVNIDNSTDHGAAAINGDEFVQINRRPPGDNNSVRFEGPWNDDKYNMCIPVLGNYYFLFYIVIFIILIPIIIYGVRYLWIYFQNMQNIKPCMPPGLGNLEKEPGEKNLLTAWPKHGIDDKIIHSDSSLNRGIHVGDISNGIMSDNCNDSENTDSTCVPSLASSNHSNSDDPRDTHEVHDEVHSETISANSSPRSRNTGSRPTSAASMHSLNRISPQFKANSLEDEPSNMHYTSFGIASNLIPTNPTNVENTKSNGYVSVGELQNKNIFNLNKPSNINHNTPYVTLQPNNILPFDNPISHISRMDLPSSFVPNGINTLPSINNIPVEKNPLVYVEDSSSEDPNYDYGDESIIIQLPNKNADVSNKPVLLDSGYVKRNDPDFLNGIEACFQKKPISAPAPKQTNLTNIVIPRENIVTTEAAISPEAYCRFGPNVNVPQPFEYNHRSEEDLEDGLLSMRTPDEYEYEKHSLLEKNTRSDPTVPPSHYVQIQNVNKS